MISLASKSVGPPDNGFNWYIQTGGGTLAAGFNVGFGDGTDTKFWLDANGIGITSAGGFTSKIASSATATRSVTIGDADGALMPTTTLVLTGTVTASANPAVAQPLGLSFTPINGATYAIEICLIATSAATTTGVQLVNTGGAGTITLYDSLYNLGIVAMGGTYAATSAPSAANKFVIKLSGVFTASSTAAVTWSLLNEVNGSAVAAYAGSYISYRRLS